MIFYLRYLKFTLITFIFTSVSQAQTSYPQNFFQSPLDIPLYLSGTFGELRSNHFHAGIDIKTQEREGLPIHASAKGYVSRIGVSPYGYGNAIYIAHENGYTTVYAHLQTFSDKIKRWVENKQYELKSNSGNYYPPKDALPVDIGEIIALSGNTGGSGGPHLHFEIRDSYTEEPINPLLFGIRVNDNIAPELNGLYIYPLNESAEVNGKHEKSVHVLKKARTGPYQEVICTASGEIGFGISTIDRLNGSNNKNGIYKIKVCTNDSTLFQFTAERFAFSESKYINAHIDYEWFKQKSIRNNRLYILPGNLLRMYGDNRQAGRLNIVPGEISTYTIEVYDYAGNKSEVQVTVKGTQPMPYTPNLAPNVPYDEPSSLATTDIRIKFPEGCFYEAESIQLVQGSANKFGPTGTLGQSNIPIHKNFELTIFNTTVPENLKSKTLLTIVDGASKSAIKGKWIGSSYEASPRAFGTFALEVDTLSPTIKSLNYKNESKVAANSSWRWKISDDLAGIEDYTALIDGEWHVLRYDGKFNALYLDIDDKIKPGVHMLHLIVVDGVGNEMAYSAVFTR